MGLLTVSLSGDEIAEFNQGRPSLHSLVQTARPPDPMLEIPRFALIVMLAVAATACRRASPTAVAVAEDSLRYSTDGPKPFLGHVPTIYETWTPNRVQVDRIESRVDYPKKVNEYARYYSGGYFVGYKKEIDAEWIKFGTLGRDPPGVYFRPLAGFPRIPNGTCDSVHIRYAVDSDQVISLECGGLPY